MRPVAPFARSRSWRAPHRRDWRIPLLLVILLLISAFPASAGASAADAPVRAQAAVFQVEYGAGIPDDAKTAFQAGIDIWATRLTSAVPIRIVVKWTAQGTCENGCTLASATATTTRSNFANAPVADTDYPIALANKLAGTDLAPNESDIEADFNSQVNWYFGSGAVPAGMNNFTSTTTHEIAHGLGFASSFDYANGQGSWAAGNSPALPNIFDRFVVNGSGQRLIDTASFPNPSTALGAQLVSNAIFFNGPAARAAAGGSNPKLYAPSTWEPGSSISHLDQASYLDGSPNSLMTPAEGAGSPATPGPITEAIFKDLGWTGAATFGDVPPGDPAEVAIAQLTARGVINGCDKDAKPLPLFCPKGTTLRHQMAALIVRAIPGWLDETFTNTFTDPTDDAELWRRVATLQGHGVVGGYTAASCTAQQKTPPCYGPLDPVLRAQAISFVTRALVKKGYWVDQPINPTLYGGVLIGTGHEQDASTYWFYTRAAGGVPDYPENGTFPVLGEAPRDWFARLLWTALQTTPAGATQP